jgi:hypothetical protein
MNKIAVLSGLLSIGLMVAGKPLEGQDATNRGEEIVREVERRSQGYVDMEARLVMRILEGDRERIREMYVRGLESDSGNRTRMTLERPADMAGTEFLSALEGGGERHQWIYLPAARRVRRISGARASDSFLGSHFTYDDMTPPKIEGFRYRWIRDEAISGQPGVVVERTSLDDRAEYPRQLLWIETERYVLRHIEFYTSDGEHRRSLDLEQYLEIGGFWLAGRMTMVQMEDSARTILEWSDMRLGVGLNARDFEPSRLGR